MTCSSHSLPIRPTAHHSIAATQACLVLSNPPSTLSYSLITPPAPYLHHHQISALSSVFLGRTLSTSYKSNPSLTKIPFYLYLA